MRISKQAAGRSDGSSARRAELLWDDDSFSHLVL
jgi:hypothetical protein